MKRILQVIKKFLADNSDVAKALRTFIQVLIIAAVDMLAAWLGAFAWLPPDLVAAAVALVSAVLAALLSALMAWLGHALPDADPATPVDIAADQGQDTDTLPDAQDINTLPDAQDISQKDGGDR